MDSLPNFFTHGAPLARERDPLKFREKQSEWFGKRGLSWHISTLVFKNVDSGKIELKSYAHIFDSCQQDWYAVCSIIENTLEVVKKEHPQITQVNLRSDEAGCYHNNFLLAAVRDDRRRVGIDHEVARYDFSDPQYGRDICDRILCLMKSSIGKHCNERHDVVSAKDMRVALSERPVQGTTASVCAISETQKTLKVHKIEGFSKYHNFEFEVEGIRAWRAYGGGLGRFIPYREVVTEPQGSTGGVIVHENFFPLKEARVYKRETNSETEQCNGLFSCSEPGATWFSRNSVNSKITWMLVSTAKFAETLIRCMTSSEETGRRNFVLLIRTKKTEVRPCSSCRGASRKE